MTTAPALPTTGPILRLPSEDRDSLYLDVDELKAILQRQNTDSWTIGDLVVSIQTNYKVDVKRLAVLLGPEWPRATLNYYKVVCKTFPPETRKRISDERQRSNRQPLLFSHYNDIRKSWTKLPKHRRAQLDIEAMAIDFAPEKKTNQLINDELKKQYHKTVVNIRQTATTFLKRNPSELDRLHFDRWEVVAESIKHNSIDLTIADPPLCQNRKRKALQSKAGNLIGFNHRQYLGQWRNRASDGDYS